MNQHRIFKKWLWAGVMGILTILLCLIVSDDLLGLNSPPARSQIGHYVFWVSLIGLPLLFYKFVSWRYTLLNIPLYFLSRQKFTYTRFTDYFKCINSSSFANLGSKI